MNCRCHLFAGTRVEAGKRVCDYCDKEVVERAALAPAEGESVTKKSKKKEE
jgi:hypothetical protein